MNPEQADLMCLGDHCEVVDCHQIDFLPFQCDACRKVFCLQHRKYQDHQCRKAGERETTAIVCPLCAKAIKIAHGQDPNAAFARHTAEACDPSNYARVHRKTKCPVRLCKEKLTSINTYNCKTCGTSVCLKHRFPGDHDCANRAAAAAAQRRPVTTAVRSFLGLGSGPAPAENRKSSQVAAARAQAQPASQGSRTASASVPRPAAPAASRAAAEAAERRRGQPPPVRSGGSSMSDEVCPQCGQRFGTLQELLFHVDALHPSSGAGITVEQCPHCGQAFGDPVTLVQHVESKHARRVSREVCVLC